MDNKNEENKGEKTKNKKIKKQKVNKVQNEHGYFSSEYLCSMNCKELLLFMINNRSVQDVLNTTQEVVETFK